MTPARDDRDLTLEVSRALEACGVSQEALSGSRGVTTPVTGEQILSVEPHTVDEVRDVIDRAEHAFRVWREVPGPARGAVVKRWGELLSEHKSDLATIVRAEAGKIVSEAEGEVQEMIDICDFALGQSRMLYGKTMPSERAGHRLMETWHPLGVVGVITAFNFPVAPYAWNTALAIVAGDPVIWKPSEVGVLCALATDALLGRAAAECGAPEGLHHVVIGDREAAQPLLEDQRVALVSATGSTRMGRDVAPKVAARFGRYLLELGGNNAAVVTPSADLDLALKGIAFAAAGTAGQRCTTMRRLIVHESVADDLVERLRRAYETLAIGDPGDEGVLVGPLINRQSYESMQAALERSRMDGGTIVTGGQRVLADEFPDAYYVEPAIVRMPQQTEVVREETFAPILYVMTYQDLDEAISLHNEVPQGLSSAIFTSDQAEAEIFLSARGSDCGIANVNIGTSGAEIGGAFGGEKDTGGGRESGSDAWKIYMRRATNTINYSGKLPLAQGVEFI
ncbi:L-piperidine-6-carboxylate dehydrogenase [Nesterenkonia aerolata]|uniref:aldehyde dehydrogenase (NAD(+)) n=1 Tax=Nesterenkonia aerolata TaxID=3074079 RepID=A0ABU2DUC2_9MICC|nr:aldehyde dehydrogenase family protein [Nesterenkonia sp. LY-0111]MDR8020104.1 aldehyde dehydrogenase family protein [Nesterenkonia sp. LY-0111]